MSQRRPVAARDAAKRVKHEPVEEDFTGTTPSEPSYSSEAEWKLAEVEEEEEEDEYEYEYDEDEGDEEDEDAAVAAVKRRNRKVDQDLEKPGSLGVDPALAVMRIVSDVASRLRAGLGSVQPGTNSYWTPHLAALDRLAPQDGHGWSSDAARALWKRLQQHKERWNSTCAAFRKVYGREPEVDHPKFESDRQAEQAAEDPLIAAYVRRGTPYPGYLFRPKRPREEKVVDLTQEEESDPAPPPKRAKRRD